MELKRRLLKTTACALCACLIVSCAAPALAAPVDQGSTESAYWAAKEKKNEALDGLDEVTERMAEILLNQDAIQDKIDELDSALVALMIEIEQTNDDIEIKSAELAEAQAVYDAAKKEEDDQRSAMSERISYMYENGRTSFFDALVTGDGFAGVLNRVSQARDVYDVDRDMLEDYQEATKAVEDAKAAVEKEEEALEDLLDSLEEQEAELNDEIAAREEEFGAYDEEYAEAQRLAGEYQDTIREMNDEIAEALGISTTVILTQGTSLEKGEAVVEYASQFIGNRYVWGGESLTDGCDCSGFVKSVYAHFGVTLPHYSGSLRHVGYEVSESEMQPGDIVCYEGHVGIYAGNGKIVNASNSRPYPQGGIKYSSVHTKKIITVRRIFSDS